MAASYPGAIHTFTPKVDGVDWVLADHINEAHEEIIATQTELGINVAGSLADLVTRLAVALDDDGTLKLTAITEHTGIADNNIVEVDGTPNSGEIAKWTANGLEGRTFAELVDTDLLEEIQDVVGAMAVGGTQTNITVTYNDTTGVLNFVVTGGSMSEVADDLTPTLGGDLDANGKDIHSMKQVEFDLYDAGTSGTAKTLDFNNGNRQTLQMTGDACDLSLTDPPAGAGTFQVNLTGDGTVRTIPDADHDTDAEWADDMPPTSMAGTSGGAIGILYFDWDSSRTPKYIVTMITYGA
jgi:hypothetical protein